MVIIHGYGAISQDVQQLGIRAWSWSGDAGADVADTVSFCIDLPYRPRTIDMPSRPRCIDLPARR